MFHLVIPIWINVIAGWFCCYLLRRKCAQKRILIYAYKKELTHNTKSYPSNINGQQKKLFAQAMQKFLAFY
ncbi:hypothetical protein DERP_008823 [Dermatophagoides pteronyssinus]|uniref:Uncharacterized protein n=1 Tax=Dermatophagoides pteronyssinus TaxID=6956 RepID=A0ABQ8IWQ1_DERPT|nr:hypothetical protein DERP_008823 [Dermatophagoides pteronyssinus]